MLVALGLLVAFGAWGYRRAIARGGSAYDGLQYAAAHGIPAGLIGMIAMTVAARMGWLG